MVLIVLQSPQIGKEILEVGNQRDNRRFVKEMTGERSRGEEKEEGEVVSVS